MDFLNWKNILAILFGGIIAGALIGGYKLYKEHQKEEIAKKLYLSEQYLNKNEPSKVESLIPEIPPPSVGYVHLRLGDYYASHKELDKALKHFEEAAKTFQKVDEPLYSFSVERSAYILYQKGEYQKSLNLLETLPENIPNFCEVELLKAQNYAALNQKDKLEQTANRVIQSCPQPSIKLAAEYLLVKYELKKEESVKRDRT